MIFNEQHISQSIELFEYTGTNQHGRRFKYKKTVNIPVASLETDFDSKNFANLELLVRIGNMFDIPVRVDYRGKQKAFIKLVSAEILRNELENY